VLDAITSSIASSRQVRVLSNHVFPSLQPAVLPAPVIAMPSTASPMVVSPAVRPVSAIFRFNGNGQAQVLMDCSSLPCVFPFSSTGIEAPFQPEKTESKSIGGNAFTICRAIRTLDGSLNQKIVIEGKEYTWMKLERNTNFQGMTETEFKAMLVNFSVDERSRTRTGHGFLRLVAVLRSTLAKIASFPNDLKNETGIAMRNTVRMLYDPRYNPSFNLHTTTYSHVEKDTFAAAVDILDADPAAKVMVVNFANNYGAGGGYANGCSAQEEDLFRCSDLPKTLGQSPALYPINELFTAGSPTSQVRAIFTPQCRILRRRSDYAFYTEEQYRKYKVSVCSIAAFNCADPADAQAFLNATTCVFSPDGYMDTQKRINMMFQMAAEENVDTLIVGAFGGGVFKSPPASIITMFNDAMWNYG